MTVGDSNAQPEVESLGGGDDEVSLLIAVRGPLEQVETLEVVAGLEHLLRRPAQLVPPVLYLGLNLSESGFTFS